MSLKWIGLHAENILNHLKLNSQHDIEEGGGGGKRAIQPLYEHEIPHFDIERDIDLSF